MSGHRKSDVEPGQLPARRVAHVHAHTRVLHNNLLSTLWNVQALASRLRLSQQTQDRLTFLEIEQLGQG